MKKPDPSLLQSYVNDPWIVLEPETSRVKKTVEREEKEGGERKNVTDEKTAKMV